jgi:hypothetical protein
MFFLRPDDRQGPTNQEATQGNLKHRWLSSLLMPGFLMLLVVVGLAGMANWFIVGWLPTLLKEKFKLDLASAGLLATLPTTIANYFAVLAGGAGADAWSIRNPRARSLLTGIGFVLCGPLLVATLYAAPIAAMMGVSLLTVFLACIVAQASAQGVMDATLMPILRGQISRGFAATGYGWLNFVSAGMGGIIVIFGGAFRDRGYDAVHILGFGGAGLFLCGLILLLIPKPRFD